MPGLPRPVTDERDGLLTFLEQQRHSMRIAAHGLTDEQARATPTPSALSVGGLIKHLAHVERSWTSTLQGREERNYEAYAASFRLSPEESLAEVLTDYDRAAAQTNATVEGITDMA